MCNFNLTAQSAKQLSNFAHKKEVLSKEIRKMLDETGIPSISIAIIKEDSIVWAEAFGYSNMKTKTAATSSTAYATGSTIKPFMSVAIMQLIEKGILDLDRPVNEYLKQPNTAFSAFGKSITLRHLLSHQSGLPSEAEFIDLWGTEQRKTLQEITQALKPIRPPEETYAYANNGFVVAALVIENVTGLSYGEYVNRNILEPLNLNTVGFFKPTPETVEQIALPYTLAYNKAFPSRLEYSQPYPSGGFTFLSPSQMSRFLMLYLNEGWYKDKKVLTKESIQNFSQTSFGHEYYGLAIGVEKANDQTLLFHDGLQIGYTASFKVNIDSKTGVYLMANATAEKQLNALNELATSLLDGKEYIPIVSFATKEFTPIILSKNELDQFAGTYRIDGTNADLGIFEKNGKLYLRNPVHDVYELVPYEKDKFFLKNQDEQIEFLKKKSKITGLKLSSDYTNLSATLIE